MPDPDLLHAALVDLTRRTSLDEERAHAVFQCVLAGDAAPEQIAALLALLEAKGIAVDELVGAARVMREHVTRVEAPADGRPVIDTCGTGGAPKAFNISTAAAIVAASTGLVRVAKHGNRSRTGRGSAEVLQALGVNVDADPAAQARCLEAAGVCFCFAIHHHPAMKHAIGPRKALGFPTIFNLLGPLTNPAGATRQLLGVYDRHRATLIAQALPRLGTDKAMVVHGLDGLDEITISASTAAMRIDAGTVTEHEIDPREFGYDLAPLDAIRVDTVDESADLIRRILDGERTPARDVVELNAAAALWTGDAAPTLAAAIDLAQGAISGGAASRTLEQLAVVSHQSG